MRRRDKAQNEAEHWGYKRWGVQRMRCRVLLTFLILWIVSLNAVANEKPWTEVRSPHFRVLTNGSISDASKVAYEFEQLRYVFATRLPNSRLESGAPLLVFAVRDEDTARKLEPRIWKNGANRAGEFHHGWERQFAIVRLDTWGGEGSKEVVYHEYTHSIEHLNVHYLPLWLDEGTAEFYAYTRFQSQRIYLGAPTERYRTLRGRTPIPVETFIGIGPRSPYYLDGNQNQLYYAEAWALVHYLTYGDGMENGKRLDQFSSLLQQGVRQEDAFERVFGDFKKVDKGLDSYMLQPTFRTAILKESPQIDEKSLLTRVMSISETEAELGGFHVWTHDLPGAHELLDQALKDDPKLALAHEQMGFLHFSEGMDSQAEAEFTKAYELDQNLYLSLFYKVMLSPLATSNNVADMNAFGAMIGKVLQLNPNFAPAYVALAKVALREGDLNSALQIARKAEELEPSLAGYHLLTAQVLKRVGKTADAGYYAKFVADRWIGPDHDEAVELWNSLPAADRPSLQATSGTELTDIEKGAQMSEGRIESVSCSDAEHERSFVLESGSHSLTFRGKSFAAGYSDTIWYGADHFSLCHHLEGMRAVIRYRPAADTSYAGEIVELGIRDDLPGSLEGALPSSTAATAH
jgi:tetratricopeptide (TPR) repeat protein